MDIWLLIATRVWNYALPTETYRPLDAMLLNGPRRGVERPVIDVHHVDVREVLPPDTPPVQLADAICRSLAVAGVNRRFQARNPLSPFTCNGYRTEKTAFKVLEVSDEYCILYGIFGLNLKSQALIGHCDQMTVYEDEAPDETFDIYFDVSLHLAHLDELFGVMDKADKMMKKSKKSKRKNGKKYGEIRL